MRLWGGRFGDEVSSLVIEFSSSIGDDEKLASDDIAGSIAHARMLGKTGIVGEDEARMLIEGLELIKKDMESGKLVAGSEHEDIHSFVEAELTARIGPVAGKLHTARSRNDQVALDLHLYVKRQALSMAGLVTEVQQAILGQAEQHVDSLMPGYTHLQPAQPVSLGFTLLARFFAIQRDFERFCLVADRSDMMPLGACALAGTGHAIDPYMVARELDFSGIYDNAADAVSDRDFAVEYLLACSVCALHLSQIADEMIIWLSPGFGFCRLPDRLATGSSIMPQKKNPDVLELVRARSGRVWGALVDAGMVLKGLPLAYNRDLQEIKPLVFAGESVGQCLEIVAMVYQGVEFDKACMAEAAGDGYLAATDVADYLVEQGLPFREAHGIAGRVVRFCEEQGLKMEELTDGQLGQFAAELGDKADLLSLESAMRRRRSPGGTAPEQVLRQIESGWERVKKQREWLGKRS